MANAACDPKPLTDKDLMYISKEIPSDWHQLGIFLDVGSNDLDKLTACRGGGISKCGSEMLSKYERKVATNDKDALKVRIQKELREMRRVDLANNLTGKDFKDEHQRQIAYSELSANLVQENQWNTLGVYLDFQQSDLDNIKVSCTQQTTIDPALEMLRLFHQQHPDDGRKLLQEALQEINNNVLADTLNVAPNTNMHADENHSMDHNPT